jgi:hypothetical protein
LTLGALTGGIVLLVPAALVVLRMVQGSGGFNFSVGVVTTLVVLGGLFFVFVLVFAVATLALRDFVAPIQMKTGMSCGAAIGVFLGLLRLHPGAFAVYVLLKIVFALVLAFVVMVAACVTCCCALVPVVSQTLLQPAFYFERAWSVFLLRPLGFDLVWAPPGVTSRRRRSLRMSLSPAEREDRIERYARGPARLKAALDRVPEEARKWRPGPGKWSVHEVVCHCADSELNAAARVRYLLAEKDPVIVGYDQEEWARRLDYHAHPLDTALRTVEAVRAEHRSPLLRRLPADAWGREGRHTESGPLRRRRLAGHLRQAPRGPQRPDRAEPRGLEGLARQAAPAPDAAHARRGARSARTTKVRAGASTGPRSGQGS